MLMTEAEGRRVGGDLGGGGGMGVVSQQRQAPVEREQRGTGSEGGKAFKI